MNAVQALFFGAVAIVQSVAVQPASAAELKLLSIGAARPLLEQLIPDFEKSTGHRVMAWWGPPAPMQAKLFQEEPVDIVFSAQPTWDQWVVANKIETGVEIARTGIGVAVRKGAPKPDLKDSEATKNFLLSAQSVSGLGFNNGSVGDWVLRAFNRMGITQQMLPKYRIYMFGIEAIQALPKGEAEVALSVMPDLAYSKEVDYVGPFPPDIQEYETVRAAVAIQSENPDAARAFIDFVVRSARPDLLKQKYLCPL
jgi:molybdate transport system substrate-binding protein